MMLLFASCRGADPNRLHESMQLEGSRAVRNINDRFTATMTNRVRPDTSLVNRAADTPMHH